ncbi:hypothetical protein M124_1106, partial [Bacteroides fragilis str. 3988T(B)14]
MQVYFISFVQQNGKQIEYFLFILAFKKFQTQDINLLEKKNNVIHKRTTKIESTLFMSL